MAADSAAIFLPQTTGGPGARRRSTDTPDGCAIRGLCTHSTVGSSSRLQRRCSVHNAAEGLGLQACTTDERPIDVGTGQQVRGVGGLDAAAVLDPDLVGQGSGRPLGQPGADLGVNVLGLLGRRRLAGANGPHGLVRQCQGGNLIVGEAVERTGQLCLDQLSWEISVAGC